MKLLRNPSCGAQFCRRLGAARKIDRCANPASLTPPQAALRRRCPARCACLRVQIAVITYKKCTHRKSGRCIFGRGRRTDRVPCTRFARATPRIACGIVPRALLGKQFTELFPSLADPPGFKSFFAIPKKKNEAGVKHPLRFLKVVTYFDTKCTRHTIFR